MPARKGGNDFSIGVDGLDELRKIPGFIDRGQRELLDKASQRIRDEVARKAPGGSMGKAGRDVEAKTLTSTTAVVRSRGFKGASALERGATIRPRRAQALRFNVGGKVIFSRGPVRLEPRGYWRKGLRPRSKIVREAYHDAFGDLRKLGA